MSEQECELSIIVPLLNEEALVLKIYQAILDEAKKISGNFEIIFVDDGSTDSTWSTICGIAKSDPNFKGLSLSRNFGHQNAMLAGLTISSGQAIITMDGDFQHPPNLIPRLVDAWKDGYKIVNTFRVSNEQSVWFKKVTSKYFYKIFSLLSDVQIDEGFSDFRLIDRKVLTNILQFNDVEFFYRGIINWVGFDSTTISFNEGERSAGISKYTFRKMIKLAASGIVAFSTIPLKIGIVIGIFTALLSFLELGYIFTIYLKGVAVPGWASTVGIMSLFFGILFILMGFLGIYIANIHECLKRRPKFIIKNEINLER